MYTRKHMCSKPLPLGTRPFIIKRSSGSIVYGSYEAHDRLLYYIVLEM